MMIANPWPKAVLLFFGLLFKALAMAEPLPFSFGVALQAVAAVVWIAFDGAFFWLLTPPKNIDPPPSE